MKTGQASFAHLNVLKNLQWSYDLMMKNKLLLVSASMKTEEYTGLANTMNENEITRLECDHENAKVYWSSQYSGFRAQCCKCEINWPES